MSLPMIQHFIYFPGGNTTALVDGEKGMDYPNIASEIMKSNPAIEQVGFLEAPKLSGCEFHLEMMGGEFCGNAARCAALHHFRKKNNHEIKFTISGFDFPVTAEVKSSVVTLNLPGNFHISSKTIPEGSLVDFHGIRFIVTKQVLSEMHRTSLIKSYQDSLEAVGVVEIQPNEYGCRIVPHVWVRSTNTLISETACASGSLAAALVLKEQGLLGELVISQPSGYDYKVIVDNGFLLSGVVDRSR